MMLPIMAGAGDYPAFSYVRDHRRAQRASYVTNFDGADQASHATFTGLSRLSASKVSGSGRLAWLASTATGVYSATDASIRRDR